MLSGSEKQCLLEAARHSIIAAVANRDIHHQQPPTGNLSLHCGAFVTLHEANELRGCIGFIDSRQPLIATVTEAAAKAALEDPRFPPVTADEVDRIEIEISVLSPPRQISDEREIEIGTHGLIVESGNRRGLLLPQVAAEFGWDRESFIEQTLRKAGLPSRIRFEKGFRMFVFTAEIFGEHQSSAV